jgi:hypothetical protein
MPINTIIFKKLMHKESFGLPNGIKRFEHFDSEDIKSKFELRELQGLIDYKSIVSDPSGLNKESDFSVIHNKLVHFHPFLEQCGPSDNSLCGVNNMGDTFCYWFDNGDWFTGLSIEKKSQNIYDCSIMYHSADTEPTDDNMIYVNGPHREEEYHRDRVMVENYEGIPFEEMIHEVIGVGFKDLLTDLGMSNFLHSKHTKEITKIQHN